ncbi:hypothetical protein HA402_004506 [Bradysia odoriphaga]|nr:hypothetical protein HA402_004506 [Bradysia odoriphaga]
MENNTTESSSSRPRWQKLIRQNSEKIGTFAEAAVLPINKRSVQRSDAFDDVAIQNVESEGPVLPTYTIKSTPIIRKKYFPIFMIGISMIEVGLMYHVDNDNLVMLFGFDPHRRHEIWRFITIMLAHTGQPHLWGNVIFQLILGVLLEIVHGWKRIGIIYVASVLGGSLFITVLNPQTYAVGASAGVYGLLFSHLSTIIINWNEMDRKCCRVFWLLAYLIYDIGYSVYVDVIINRDSNTSHAGHLGGAITGFLVSIFVLKNFEKHPWEEKMQKVCVRLIIAIAVIVIIINVTAWGLYTPTELNFNYLDTYEKYIFKLTMERPDDAELRSACEENEHCKRLLDEQNFNGTIT